MIKHNQHVMPRKGKWVVYTAVAAVCLITSAAFAVLPGTADAHIWSSAVPTEINLVPGGLVLLGDFDNTGVTCATGRSAIFLPDTDPNFKGRLAMALTAIATGKKIQVLLLQPSDIQDGGEKCAGISAHGSVPVAFYYYWSLK